LRIHIFKSRRKGLTRLVVGGLHGREGRTVKLILKRFILEGGPRSGMLIVVPSLCDEAKYVSTLSKRYFETEEGRKLLNLLSHYKPDVYVEVHCYSKKAFRSLTSPMRMVRKGVPQLIELERGVLIGSSSPLLLSTGLFRLGVTVEVPCRNGESRDVLLRLLRIVRDREAISEVLGELMKLYPKQLSEAIKLFEMYKQRLGLS